MEDGGVYSWGFGGTGVLGHGSFVSKMVPKEIEALSELSIHEIAIGESHCAAMNDVGQLFCWGEDSAGTGKLGFEVQEGRQNLPREVKRLKKAKHIVRMVSCGGEHTCVVTELGIIVSMGSNAEGQLGFDNLDGKADLGVVNELRGQRVVGIGCGYSHTVAVTEMGRLFSWGLGAVGQLGHGHLDIVRTPTEVKALADVWVVSVACGGAHSCAVDDQGKLYSWGLNDLGSLGWTPWRHSRPRDQEAAPGEDEPPRTRAAPDEVCPVPSEVTQLGGARVVQLQCGLAHTAVVVSPGIKSPELKHQMGTALTDQQFCDTWIVPCHDPDKMLGCHGFILEARCPRLLEHRSWKEDKHLICHPEIQIVPVAQALLEYLYTGELHSDLMDADGYSQLLTLTVTLELEELEHFCRSCLVHQLDDAEQSPENLNGFAVMQQMLSVVGKSNTGKMLGGAGIPPLPLGETLLGCLNSPLFSDIELKVEGGRRSVRAHRAILVARSARFRAYFLTGQSSDRAKVIEVPRVKYPVFLALLDFIYTDTVHSSLSVKSAAGLLKLGLEYQLPRLTQICDAVIAHKALPRDLGWLLDMCVEHLHGSRLHTHLMYTALTLPHDERVDTTKLSTEAARCLEVAAGTIPRPLLPCDPMALELATRQETWTEWIYNGIEYYHWRWRSRNKIIWRTTQ
eukprot:TRINITY_DN5148_c0_g4_i1.p1 TRINITY_DN5148_c0_g4~~TRINITY_DN5148_c0_g4_i1.p1  ORF type:complete len:679 (+),score=118.64 TRINITY_DN5148_c0_g4_i1:249-2285(+)